MREEFIKKIIIGQLEVNLEEILGIQRNGREKYLDVTMKCQTYFKKLILKYMENEEVYAVRGQEERGSLRAKDEAVEGVQTQKALVSNSKETSKMLAPTKAVVLERDKRQAEEQGELKEGVSFTDSELARVLIPYGNDEEGEEGEEPEGMEEENNGGSEGTVILDTNINKSSWGERVEELEEGEHSKWDKVPGKRKLIDIEEDIVPTYNRFESFLSEISDGTSGDSDGSVVSVIGGSQVSEESVGLEMEGSEVESSEAEGYLGNNGVEGFKGVIGFTEEKKEGKEETERKKKKEHE
ncbi:UNVERIFIED_CONTAM: hypothetical protein FKN15_063371 [Acipenser sinensis]